MKNAHIMLFFVLAFVAGSFAGNPRAFYHVQPVSSTEVDVACTSGRPKTAMRLDGLLKVYCFPRTEESSKDEE